MRVSHDAASPAGVAAAGLGLQARTLVIIGEIAGIGPAVLEDVQIGPRSRGAA